MDCAPHSLNYWRMKQLIVIVDLIRWSKYWKHKVSKYLCGKPKHFFNFVGNRFNGNLRYGYIVLRHFNLMLKYF